MKGLLFWGLLPLLLPQALYVRHTAPRFAAAAGPDHGSIGEGDAVSLLAVGDSIVAGVGADSLASALVGQTAASLSSALERRVDWHAIGRVGLGSAKIIEQLLPELPARQADFIIVSAGVNDITGLTTIAAWRRNLGCLLECLSTHSPMAVIGVAGIPPMKDFPLLPQPLRAMIGLRASAFDEAARKKTGEHERAVYVPVEFEPDPARFAGDGYQPFP